MGELGIDDKQNQIAIDKVKICLNSFYSTCKKLLSIGLFSCSEKIGLKMVALRYM